MFEYAQITNPHPVTVPTVANPNGATLGTKAFPGPTLGVIIDQPAVAAAITASLTTGIIEANLSAAATKSDLIATVTGSRCGVDHAKWNESAGSVASV